MAAERNVITILIQAIDRASGVLNKHRREVSDLEKAERKAIPTAREYGDAQSQLAINTEEAATATDLHGRSLDRSNQKLLRQVRTTREYKDDVSGLRRETAHLNDEMGQQLQFFEKLASFQRRHGDFFGQRQRQVIQGRGGRLQGSLLLPLGAAAGGDETTREVSRDQLRFPDLTQRNLDRLFNLLPKITRDGDRAKGEVRGLDQAAQDFFRTLRTNEGRINNLVREFRQLGGGRTGDIGGSTLTTFFRNESARARAAAREATTFEDRNAALRQAQNIDILAHSLHGLRLNAEQLADLRRRSGALGLGDDGSIRTLVRGLGNAEREVRRFGDLVGENGPIGRGRAVFRGFGQDIDRHLTPGLTRVGQRAERLGRFFGNSRRELDQFANSLQRSSRGLLDVTRFDDTVQVGLRRLTRLLVIVGAFVPFIVAGFGALTGAVTALVGGVTALAGAFSQLVGVAAALPAILVATIGAFGAFQAVVGPGITNITNRFKEARQVQESARKQSTENARAEQQAQETLARTRQQNAEQVADQERQIAVTRRNNAEQERDAELNLIQLKRRNAEQEADLVRDLRRAKREAASDAAQREREYQALVKQNRADEREIAQELSIRRAQLGALRLQGADPNQIRAAEAGVAASERELSREQTQNRTQEAKQRSDNAKARQNDLQQIADLERRITRTRRDDREQEAEAERNLARLRRNNAEQIADQERQLARTIRDGAEQEKQALDALAESRRKASGDLKDTLAGLEPAEKRVVVQLLRMRQEWLNLTRATRTNALNFGADVLTQVEQHLPALAARANQFTNALIGLGREAFARFTTPQALGRINRILDDGLRLTRQFGEAVINVADAFLTLADRASPVTRHIGDIVQRMAESIRRSTQQSEQSGGLDEFFARTNRVLDKTLAMLGNLGRALLNVLKIGEPFGEVLLGDLVQWSERVQRFTENQAPAIESFFRDSVPVVEELGGLLSDIVVQLFRIGRELIRPNEQGDVFLIDFIRNLREGLPGFADFIIELTEKSGPRLLDFLQALGRFVGLLVGPDGAFLKLLDVLTFIFNAIDALPGPVAQLGVAFVAFGGILNTVGGQIRRFLALLAVGGRGGAGAGGASAASIVAGLRGTAFGLLIAALIIFPGLLDPVVRGIQLLSRTVETLLEPFNKLGEAFGFSDDAGGNLIKTLFAIDIALRVFAGTSFLRILASLRTFIQLVRESQRATIFGRIAEVLSAAFPAAAKAIGLAIDAVRNYIRTIKAGRRENQLYQASNIANAFTDMVSPIGQAIASLLRYIAQVRAARRENRLLAISNATLGFSSFAPGIGGLLGGLPGLLGGLRGLAGRALVPLTALFEDLGGAIARMGALGTAGIIVGVAAALSKFGAEVDKLVPPLKRLDDFMARFIGDQAILGGIRRIVEKVTSLGPDPFGLRKRFFGDAEDGVNRNLSQLARIGNHIQTTLRGVGTGIRQASRSVFFTLDLTVQDLKTRLDTIGENVQNVLDALQQIQDTANDFIRARIEAKPLPAQVALDRLDRQETLRDRAQRRQQANQDLAEAKRQQRLQEQSLSTALARLARLRARLAGGGRIATTAGGRDVFVQAPPLTPQQRAATRQAIREQEQIVRERQRAVNEAKKQVQEVAKAREETLRQIAVEEKRDALQRDLERQQAQREQEIAQAQKRANDAIEAYTKALDSGKIPITRAQKRLVEALFQAGVPREQTRAWLAGRKLGQDFNSGFADAVAGFGEALRTLIGKEITKQKVGAPVVIVTNAATIRRIIREPNRRPQPGDPDFIGPVPVRPGAAGMRVPGGEGQPVPILAHAGEWVLNRSQQSKLAFMAGLDRSLLERSLFYKLESRAPRFNFALGGVVTGTGTTHGSTTFLTPISVQTASPTVDAEYLARALETRIRQVI